MTARTQTNGKNEQIAAFLAAWTGAERRGDTAWLGRHLAADFEGIGPLGFVLSRAQWLERHAGGDLSYETYELSEVHTRVYGNVATVTAHQTAKGAYRGNPVPPELRASLLLIDGETGWQLAGVHFSFIAGTPGAPPVPGR